MRHITHNALFEEQLWKLRIAPVIARPQAALHPVLFHQLSGRIPYGLARTLRKARQDIAHHQGIGAQGQCNDHVRRATDAAISDQRHVDAGVLGYLLTRRRDLQQRRSLAAPRSFDLLRRAPRANPHTDFDRIHPGVDEKLKTLPGDHIAADHRHRRVEI